MMGTWRLVAALWMILLCSCTDRQRLNPLDPEGAVASDLALQALAGDQVVSLRWDCTRYTDVTGVRLLRREADDPELPLTTAPLARGITEFDDRQVRNGVTYEYALALQIEGEGERRLDPAVRATPGSEIVWAADRTSGLLWRVTADGRTAWFAQGRFAAISGVAVDPVDRSCWVSDQYARGVARVSTAGDLDFHRTPGREPALLALDPESRRGWLVDRGRQEVCWWSLDRTTDTLALSVADARFAEPVALAPAEGGCWIADRSAGRVLFWSPDGRRLSFENLDRPVALAAGSGQVWVLTAGGDRLLRLGPDGATELTLPLTGGLALAWEPASGRLFIQTESEVLALGTDGALLARWTGFAAGRSLALSGRAGSVWVATANWLWKVSAGGETLARLGGFSGLLGVAVTASGS
jgi:hypothetical protein